MNAAILFLGALALGPAAPGEPCALELITHGTLHVEAGPCVTLVSDLGDVYEIVDTPVYEGEDGLTGTIYAQMEERGPCTGGRAAKVCNLVLDYSRRVKGTLVFLNNIECPGYVVETDLASFLIRNCEDFGDDLCVPGNLGRSIRAEVFVDTGVSICLGLERSTLLGYSFPP